ncbi:MAG TPA: hypothetical protein VFN75_02745 [Pseudonocardiaceae bacterium]|nr:hypothetical protein [Pseudonocardiaceae bacterium]
MTAPAHTTTPIRARTAAPAGRREAGPQRGRSPAVARAYARRAQRTGPRHGDPAGADAGRAPFVMLVMALLGVALVATLWLSTAATADSYHLQSARKVARNLTEHSESLGRQVATLETAPELARQARELGMVPAGDPARLVVRPDGSVEVLGQPRRATAPAPPAPAPQPPAMVAAPAPQPGTPAPQPTSPATGPVPSAAVPVLPGAAALPPGHT